MIQFVSMISEQKHQTAEITSPVPFILNRMVDAVLQALSIVFIGAVLFMHIENWSPDREPKLEFFQSVYFIITTMTTVGYGDISPSSNLAQAFTCLLMFYLLLVLFPMITDAAEMTSRVTKYNSMPAMYTNQPVIVWQAEGQISCDRLNKICEELFISDQAQRVSICVVCDEPPTSDMEAFLNVRRIHSLTYIDGSLHSDEVCDRAGVACTKACILMCTDDCPCDDMLTQDESICIMGMRVRQYVADKSNRAGWSKHPIRVILSLNRSYNAVYFNSGFYGALPTVMTSNIDCKDATTSVSIREIQLQVLAKGIVCPGFAPFIANIASFCGDTLEEMGEKEALLKFELREDPWLKEYFSGAAHELYTLSLPFRLNSVAVPKLAAMLYHETNCVMLQYSREVQLDGTMHLKVLAPTYKVAMECDDYLKTLLASSVRSHPVWDTLSIKAPGATASSKRITNVKDRLKRMQTIEAYYGEDDEEEKLLSPVLSSPDYVDGSDFKPDDGHPEPALKMVFSSGTPGGAADASLDQHTKRTHATPLSLEECSSCLLQYQETSFEENYGPIREFSERHHMHPMGYREEEITRDEDEEEEDFQARLNADNNKEDGMEALLQKPHNDVMMLRTAHYQAKHLDKHIIIVVQHLRHVSKPATDHLRQSVFPGCVLID